MVSWKSFLLIPIVYIATVLPAWLAGRPFVDLLLIYQQQSSFYTSLSMNAPNMYRWFPNDLYDTLYPAGLIWIAAIIFLFCIAVYKSRVKIGPDLMIQLATVSLVFVPFFLPKTHERHFFPADVVSILFGFYFPRYFYVPLVVGMVSFFSYFPFLFGFEVIPLSFLALALLITIFVLFRHLAGMLYTDLAQSLPKAE
jgi:Gpi18-like mannosyltransferase